ncbi:hypothetical protein PGC35_03330 [Psychrobacillus sp. PGGUH221]|uniref:hypothetical protein n=1 Tax=Psychrobacillus sp. PGGUH221 TaxID=3020058 RepID=UPI0035C75746
MTKFALSHKTPNKYESYFITNGPQEDGTYIVSYQQTNFEILHLSNCSSLNECRITISNFILEILNETTNTVFNQLCKKPGREKDRWDQWRVSQFI